jgi:MFS family permease
MGSTPEATPEPSFDTSDNDDNRSAEKGGLEDGVAAKPPSRSTSGKMSVSQIPRTLLLATLYASISGLLFGYQLGVVGGALASLQSSFDLSSSQTESITSIFFIGLMIGSPFGGYACDRLGRRSSIMYMDGLFVLAAVVLTVAPNYDTLLAGRFIAGCASGVSLVAAVSYLTELASVEHHQSLRGALVTAVEWNIALGFLVSYLSAYFLTVSLEFEEGWRLLFGVVTGLLAILQWMGMRVMPESPEWLAEQGFHDKAHAALRRITPRNSTMESGSDQSLAGRIAEVEDEVLGRSEQRVSLEYGEVNFFMLEDCPPVSHYWRQAIM